MSNELVPRRNHDMAQVERVGERMRDATELDNLTADTRMSHGKELTMPWKIGRGLRSAGTNALGEPITPLAALNLHELITPTEMSSLNRELDRVLLHDAVSEGVLDIAEALGVPLTEEEQWWEADTQSLTDEAIVTKQLSDPATITKDARHYCVLCDEPLSTNGDCTNHDCNRYKAGHPSDGVSGNQL
jgi:hypothetical protein